MIEEVEDLCHLCYNDKVIKKCLRLQWCHNFNVCYTKIETIVCYKCMLKALRKNLKDKNWISLTDEELIRLTDNTGRTMKKLTKEINEKSKPGDL